MQKQSPKLRGLIGRHAKRILKDTSGNISMIFALSMIPMMLAVGAGIDSARMAREHATFNSSVDAAAIAIGGDPRSATVNGALSPSAATQLAELAKKYILANYSPDKGGSAGTISVQVSGDDSQLVVTSQLDAPTTIMKLAGVDFVHLEAKSVIKKARRPVELVLVMDTTGSMASNSKLTNAKTAARDLLIKIYGGSRAAIQRNDYLRVALVPFAAAVRVDPSSAGVSSWVDTAGNNPLSRQNFNGNTMHNFLAWTKLKNSSGNLSWNGCLEARKRPMNINDDPPVSGSAETLFPPFFAPDEPSIRNDSSYDGVGSPGNWRGFTYSNSYIGEDAPSGSGNTANTVVATGEAANLSVADKKDMTVHGFNLRMKNPDKYNNRTVSDSESNDGPWAGCVATPIVPMTFNRESIEQGIDAMVARGNTNIAEGLAWGMRVISPTEPFSRVAGASVPAESYISDYDLPGNFTGANALKKKWQKIMLLMTDGDNSMSPGRDELNQYSGYSSSERDAMNLVIRGVANQGYSSYGYRQVSDPLNRFGTSSTVNNPGTGNDYPMYNSDPDDLIDADMAAVCTAIKNNKVTLYVTSFGNGVSTTTQNKLRSCATPQVSGSSTEYYTHSTTGADLQAFFNGVGRDVLNKMIYVAQ